MLFMTMKISNKLCIYFYHYINNYYINIDRKKYIYKILQYFKDNYRMMVKILTSINCLK